MEKSRRIGISWADAADSALEAAKVKGCDTYYVGYNFEMAQQYIKDVAFWAKAYALAVSDFEESVIEEPSKSIFTYTIRFTSGYKVTALSSRPANLRSKKGRLRVDEAAHHEDLSELLKAALAIVMWGGNVGIWSTHNGEENDFNQLIQEVKRGDRHFSLHRATLQDALNDGLYERICLVEGWTASPAGKVQWTRDVYADHGSAASEELDCTPSARKGDAIYSSFDPVLNHCDDYPLPSDRLLIGMDFNVGKMAAIVHVMRERLPRAVDELVDVQDTPAMIAAIKQRYPQHDKARLITIYPDASGASRKSSNAQTSDIALLRQAGFGVIVNSTNPAVRDRINAMNTAFCSPDGKRDYKVNTHRCPSYKQSLLKQVWKNGEPDKTSGFDHPNDAAGYVISKQLPVVDHRQYSTGRSPTASDRNVNVVRQALGS
ncbi:MAG: hypothetical protein DCF22_00545 [Leptolyngbya sp.]|nr:MAG: hypothetical protein DCF22_00545 [Leptolyngbya sp.]